MRPFAKTLITALIVIIISSTVHAQGDPKAQNRRENLESVKIAFITKKLSLSPEEAQKFWPVYNQNQKELETLRSNHREQIRKSGDNIDEMSDGDVEKYIAKEMIFRQQELDLIKKHLESYKKVLPIKKVARLYRAEKEFIRGMIARRSGAKREKAPAEKRSKGPRRF